MTEPGEIKLSDVARGEGDDLEVAQLITAIEELMELGLLSPHNVSAASKHSPDILRRAARSIATAHKRELEAADSRREVARNRQAKAEESRKSMRASLLEASNLAYRPIKAGEATARDWISKRGLRIEYSLSIFTQWMLGDYDRNLEFEIYDDAMRDYSEFIEQFRPDVENYQTHAAALRAHDSSPAPRFEEGSEPMPRVLEELTAILRDARAIAVQKTLDDPG